MLAAAVIVGYRAGLTRIIFFSIQVIAAVIAAIFLYPSLADFMNGNFPSFFEWARPVAFAAVFLIVFALLAVLSSLLMKRVTFNHHSKLNRISGTIAGLLFGCIGILSIARCTDVVNIPQYVELQIEESQINDFINPFEDWMTKKMLAVFQEPGTQVLAVENTDSVSHDAVALPYITNDFELRNDLEIQMLQLINQEREKHGLKLLLNDEALNKVARAHAADMFKRGYFSHNTPEGINPFQRLHRANIKYKFAGENLAMAPAVSRAHSELMNSPGHRANMLNPSYGRIGIGILQSAEHGLMVTQEFRD
jgi:uncharacterized protein YkwD